MTNSDTDPYPKTVLGRTIRSFWHFVGNLTGSGARTVRPIQQQLLDAFLPALEINLRELIIKQLSQPYYMQFWNGGRISPFFFDDFNLTEGLRISDPAFHDRLYTIDLFVDGRKQRAHVTFYNGRIHTLEFKEPLKFYDGKGIRFGKVRIGRTKETFTHAIDRSEHGRRGTHATGE